MMKRYLKISSRASWVIVLFVTLLAFGTASARKLKVYSLPKSIVPGQIGIIVFENPDPTHAVTRASCTADRLIGWVKSDIPILRIEQNGKQVWTSFGSYQTVGDSCIATFMAPVIFVTGRATVYLVNASDPSIPYYFTIAATPTAAIAGVEGGVDDRSSTIKPLTKFRVIGDGFVPEGSVNEKKAREELEENIGLSKLSPAEQWTALNHRIMKDWDKLPTGNFLYLEQGGKSWRCFAETCGITPAGMTLEFTAPPDIVPGSITLTLGIRMNGAEVFKTSPVSATVSQ